MATDYNCKQVCADFFSVVNIPYPSPLLRFFQTGARIFFAASIVLAPFRLRATLWTRPFFPVYSDYTDFLLFACDVPVYFMLVFWGCSLLIAPRRLRLGNSFIFFLLAGLTVAAWVSVLGSVDAVISRYQAFHFVVLLIYYLFIVNEIVSAWWVIVPVFFQAMVQAPIGVGQFFAQSSLGLQALGEHKLDPLVKGASIIPVNGERVLRAYGLADHPNILGGCLAFAMVILLAVVLYGERRKSLISAAGILFIFPAFLLTFSRSAWLSFFIASLFLAVFNGLTRSWESVIRLCLLGAACVAVATVLVMRDGLVFGKRFNGGDVAGDGPMVERVFLMEKGNTLFVEHSAIGVGLGASPLAMKLRFGDFPVSYQPPHFTPLTVSLETGVLGGAFYFILFLLPFMDFLIRWRMYIHNPVGMGVMALLLAIFVVNLFDYYTWSYTSGRIWQWLAWALYSQVSTKAGK